VTEPQRPGRDAESFWHRRRPGIRYLYSIAASVGGIVFIIRHVVAPSGDGGGSGLLAVGVALLVLGASSIPIYRWMDQRKL
jgi:drug/metabolite transporter (DMT)-like permease